MTSRYCLRGAAPLIALTLLPSAAHAEQVSVGGGLEANSNEQRGSASVTVDSSANDPELTRVPAPSYGFEHGLRVGVSLPFGETDEGNNLRSGDLDGVVGVRVPLWLDVGYRLDESWWLGIAAQLGLGTTGGDCEDSQECEWSDLRLAAQATLALAPGSSSDPWIGFGLGWEWLRGSITLTIPAEQIPDVEQDIPIRLQELLGGPQAFVQGGLRFDLGESLKVGPYLSGSLGTYLTDSLQCPDVASACDGVEGIDDTKLHAWVGLGVRATHGP